MKKPLFLALACAALVLLVSPRSLQAQEENISFQVFYDALAPYGEWLNVEGYGYCWRPTVDENWAPYTDGSWAYTDAGWTWCGNEKWSWAPYHYGRWTQLENLGWIWVPGYEWAPAWVSWRDSDEYVGWAPLPPTAVWVESVGFNSTVDVEYGIAPSYYSFCPVQYFGAPVLIPYIQPYWNNAGCFRNSKNVTRIARQGNSIFLHTGGPDLAVINQRVQRPFQQLRLEPQRNVDPRRLISGQGGNFQQNNVLQVVAPQVVNATARPQSVAAEIPRQQAVRVSNRVPPGQRANPAANATPVQNTVPPPVTYTYPVQQQVVPVQPNQQANQNGQGRHDRPDRPNRPYPTPGTVSATPSPQYYQPNTGSVPVSISGTMTHQLVPKNHNQPSQQQVPNGTISPQQQQFQQQQVAQQQAAQQQAAQQQAAQQAAQQRAAQQAAQQQAQQQQYQQQQFQQQPQYQPQQPQIPTQPQGQFVPTGGVGGDGRHKGH